MGATGVDLRGVVLGGAEEGCKGAAALKEGFLEEWLRLMTGVEEEKLGLGWTAEAGIALTTVALRGADSEAERGNGTFVLSLLLVTMAGEDDSEALAWRGAGAGTTEEGTASAFAFAWRSR